ncbi:MAG: membrane protein insertase YidC [Synergistetes bacterium]|nr:membrane protein insertase YidC [Synergistota bacterium]
MWEAASDLVRSALVYFYHLTGNAGLAIIILTVLVRLLLYPLMHKQLKSMQQIQKLQPRIKRLQEKYKNDKEKLNQELMKLYKEEGVNPASGCLPLLAQMPVLILLFRVLMSHKFDNPSFLWIKDLSKPDIVLLVLVVLETFLHQKLTATVETSPQAKMMNWIMPIFILVIAYNLPAGVLLYWLVSSLIGLGHQLYIMKRFSSAEAGTKVKLYKEPPRRVKEGARDEGMVGGRGQDFGGGEKENFGGVEDERGGGRVGSD